jgi:hypothetical protein
MKKTILILGITMAIIFSACKNDTNTITANTDNTFKIDTVRNLIADSVIANIPFTSQNQNPPPGAYGYGKYTFYSLRTNSIVPNSDSLNTNWDLAFKGTTIRVNCGTSGIGNGGAYVYSGLFGDLKTIDINSIKKDTTNLNAIPTGSGNGWYYNVQNPINLITPIPGRILAIRTADGKFAKVEILNYYKGGITPASNASDSIKAFDARYYTFRYSYQPNGTPNF